MPSIFLFRSVLTSFCIYVSSLSVRHQRATSLVRQSYSRNYNSGHRGAKLCEFGSLRVGAFKKSYGRSQRMSTSLLGSCQVIPASEEGLSQAADTLKKGGLVAFPTETVYGLGANALNEEAVRAIFTAKGRPLTDPLIVHVTGMTKALQLVEVSGDSKRAFVSLGNLFWPGPLTIIVKAAPCIPSAITADTGFVGIRVPNHSLSQALLEKCDLPLAAPSANRFGHVSPTKSSHVAVDFLQHHAAKEILILNGEIGEDREEKVAATCDVGIESTVIKIISEEKKVQILRQGAVVKRQIEEAMLEIDLDYEVETVLRAVKMESSSHGRDSTGPASTEQGQQAPGQAITHYAPDVPCVIATGIQFSSSSPFSLQENEHLCLTEEELKSTVVIDLGGKNLIESEGKCLAYRDLSISGDMTEAARRLFDVLRWAEGVEGAKLVLLPYVESELNDVLKSGNISGGYERTGADESNGTRDMTPGLVDRMFRAASGKFRKIFIAK